MITQSRYPYSELSDKSDWPDKSSDESTKSDKFDRSDKFDNSDESNSPDRSDNSDKEESTPYIESERWTDVVAQTSILCMLVMILFVGTYAIKAFTDRAFMEGTASPIVAYSKYVTAILVCVLAQIDLLVNARTRVFRRETYTMLAVIVWFIAYSVALMIATNHISQNVLLDLIKLAMPIIFAYFVVNELTDRQLYVCMILVLCICCIGYLHDLYVTGVSPLDIVNAQYSESKSKTEGSNFAELALMLTLFFAIRNTYKLPLVVSTLFCVLTFKRLGMLVAIIACGFALFFPRIHNIRLPRFIPVLGILGTLGTLLAWWWLLLPDQEHIIYALTGTSTFTFTSGRSSVLEYLSGLGFQSWGYGSASEVSTDIFGVIFEFDFIKIVLELGWVSCILLIIGLWSLTNRTFWGTMLIAYYSLNMISSDSLGTNFAMTLAFIVLYVASVQEQSVRNRKELRDSTVQVGALQSGKLRQVPHLVRSTFGN